MEIELNDMNNSKITVEYDKDKNIKIFFQDISDNTSEPINIETFNSAEIKEIQLIFLKYHPIADGSAYSIVFIFNDDRFFELTNFKELEKAKNKLNLLSENFNISSNDLSDSPLESIDDFLAKNNLI